MKGNLSLETFSARNRASSLPVLLERSPIKVQPFSVGTLRRRVQTEPDSYEHLIEAEKHVQATKAAGQSILNRMRRWLKRNPSTKKENKSEEEVLTTTEPAMFVTLLRDIRKLYCRVEDLQRKIDSLVENAKEREEDADQTNKELEKLWADRVICLSTLENCTASCNVLISRARVLVTGMESGMFNKEDIEQRKDSFVNEIDTLKKHLLFIVSTLVQEETQNQVPDQQHALNQAQSFEPYSADCDHGAEDTDGYTNPLEEQLTSVDHSLSALTRRIQQNEFFIATHGRLSQPKKEYSTGALCTNFQASEKDRSFVLQPIVSQSHAARTDLEETESVPGYEIYTKTTPQAPEFEEIKQKVEFILLQQSRVEQELKTLTQTQQEISEKTPAMLSSLQTQLSNLSATLHTSKRSAKPRRSHIQDFPSGLPKYVKVLPTNGDCSDIGSKTPPLRDMSLD